MLLDILFPINYAIIDQLALNLVYLCIDNTLKILCKSLLYFVKIRKINYSEIAKIWLVKFCMFNFKIVHIAQFLEDFYHRDLNLSWDILYLKNEILIIKQNTSVLLLTKRSSIKQFPPRSLNRNQHLISDSTPSARKE